MCDKCQKTATNPTPSELEHLHEQVSQGAEAINVTIHMNLGGARGPIDAVVRIAAARAWAQFMEDSLCHVITPEVAALGRRLLQDELERAASMLKTIDPTGEKVAHAKAEVPPSCRPPPAEPAPAPNMPPAIA
jgi:hypothetical protein